MTYKLNRSPVVGESYTRCNQVIIDNRLGRAPAITFGQETVIGTGTGDALHVPMAPIGLAFDPAAQIAVIDPDTGEPTGAMVTQAEVYALVYSAYIAAATPAPGPTEEAV
ncbi:hypothetical protein PUH89_04000 [Rhodobacter capsulatus]|uniref:Uncharacterized protein n=1 Tax=Rhodobacter capsulatus TaxID=1061 RepID=A0A1G7PWF8_RHOCA|nr:hypothetical protein [Rhodobacter capsulatus]WER10164.1 hypothetical protein PUH89_04000 [Rhodobacter capsulatus]SDF89939.1 hypothetical protein SAMN04244550_03053 [Rhodobacter capsulatus]